MSWLWCFRSYMHAYIYCIQKMPYFSVPLFQRFIYGSNLYYAVVRSYGIDVVLTICNSNFAVPIVISIQKLPWLLAVYGSPSVSKHVSLLVLKCHGITVCEAVVGNCSKLLWLCISFAKSRLWNATWSNGAKTDLTKTFVRYQYKTTLSCRRYIRSGSVHNQTFDVLPSFISSGLMHAIHELHASIH